MELRFVVPNMEKTFGNLEFAGENTTEQQRINGRMAVITRSYNLYSDVQRADDVVVTVQYIADKLNLNRSYLSEIFSKQMGVPLKKYILDFRITQSEEFLFTSDWSVDYISQICGFSSPSYFSKIFKEYHGISPTEYRKNRHKRERQIVLVK